MKTVILVIAALAVGFGLAYLVMPAQEHQAQPRESVEKQQYTCGMHPEIITDEPGYCPICGMKLTPKKKGAGPAGSVTINSVTRQNMGLVTTPVRYQSLTRKVHAFGKIAFAEPLMYGVNLKVDGWIERLLVDHEGERVYEGQPLLEIYSPALVAAQKEFLIAGESGQSTTDLLRASRLRLANWDISDDQIERLTATGEITRTMTIHSPANGVVVARRVSEGDHLKPGTELYQIADLSMVWVVAHVYEQDIPFVSLGQEATVTLPNLAGDRLTATVSYVSPFLDAHGQVEIRLDVNNSDYQLKPEMYAEVTIDSKLDGNRLVIPRSAVINSGTRELVYVASDESNYEPRIIVTGAVDNDDNVEVISGLTEHEQVVISGQFLLDSESRLSEALAEGYQAGHQHADHGAVEEFDHDVTEASDPDITEVSDPDELLAIGGHDIYTCPMPEHDHVLQYGEGSCPECGMKLVPLAETEDRLVYVCPMTECGVVQDHKGTCPECGMNLVRYQPEESHDR